MSSSASVGPILAELGCPNEVGAVVQVLLDEVAGLAETNLSAFVLYGSLARRRYRPGRSDVNVAIVLRQISASALCKIGPPLQRAWRAARVEPMVLAAAEISQLAQVFPLKLLDIEAHHVVLYGQDPFLELRVSPQHVRWRLEQQLRNLELRLRRRYVAVAEDPALLARLLADAARSLAVDLSSLMRVAGKPLPAEDHTDVRLQGAAEAFGLDKSALSELANLRRASRPPRDLRTLFDKVLATIDQALERVEQLDAAP